MNRRGLCRQRRHIKWPGLLPVDRDEKRCPLLRNRRRSRCPALAPIPPAIAPRI